jgi:hypothetical protein
MHSPCERVHGFEAAAEIVARESHPAVTTAIGQLK